MDLAHAIANMTLKHLPGKHDQLTHGSWAGGDRKKRDFSPLSFTEYKITPSDIDEKLLPVRATDYEGFLNLDNQVAEGTVKFLSKGLADISGKRDLSRSNWIGDQLIDRSIQERGMVKESIIKAISERSGISQKTVNKLIGEWANTSNDASILALSLQKEAAEVFGLQLSEYQKGRLKTAEEMHRFKMDADKILEHFGTNRDNFYIEIVSSDMKLRNFRESLEKYVSENYPLVNTGSAFGVLNGIVSGRYVVDNPPKPAVLKKFIKAMYEETQERFRAHGYKPDDEITLFRGVDDDAIVGNFDYIGQKVAYRGNVMESWTASANVGSSFGGVVLGQKVKVRNVISTARTGTGCLTEAEYVILGNSNPGSEAQAISAVGLKKGEFAYA
jgi:hypothetical protein